MAFQYNHYYEIYNGGKYVNLNGDHENNVVNNGEKVTMYARTNNPDQRWALERYGSDNQVRIVLQRSGGWYALNYNTENTNCIVWHLNSAADKDTVITLEPAVSFGGVYRLKLAQRNLYLTVVGSSLKWMAFTNKNDQIFSFVEPGTNPGSGTDAHTIPMPVNLNQKYRSNSEWIKNWGCAVCCGVDLASWLNKKTYTIDDFIMRIGGVTRSGVGPMVFLFRHVYPFLPRAKLKQSKPFVPMFETIFLLLVTQKVVARTSTGLLHTRLREKMAPLGTRRVSKCLTPMGKPILLIKADGCQF